MALNGIRKNFKYYEFIMAAFVTVLLCSNLISSSKVGRIGNYSFGSGILLFPISYIFGDVLTEVYGYARARRVVWVGFGAMIFASFISWMVLTIPPDPDWHGQAAFQTVFGSTPRIIFSSLIAFWAGEFSNSYILAKMKILTNGKHLWSRIVGSTILGEAVDSIIFYPLAFLGVWDQHLVIKVMISNYILKVLWEVLMTPVTYRVVAFLKKAEHEDYYDTNTDFTPFSIKT